MKQSLCTSLLAAFSLAAVSVSAGDAPFAFTDTDNLAISWHGTPVVARENFSWLKKDGFQDFGKRRETISANEVFNSFGEVQGIPFRREAVLKAGGQEVEISIQFNVPAYSPASDIMQTYTLAIPFDKFAGWNFEAVTGRISNTHFVKGIIAPDAADDKELAGAPVRQVRLLAPDGKRSIIFDCSPEGVNDFYSDYPPNGIMSLWSFKRQGNEIRLAVNYMPRFYGGSQSAKAMIYEGTDENVFENRHAQKSYDCCSELPAERQYVFGAEKSGKAYTPIHIAAFEADAHAGWLKPDALKKETYLPSGALYSAVSSDKANTFRMTGLRGGVHLVTLGIPGFEKPVGPMSVTVNGIEMLKDFSAPEKSVSMVTLPVWIEGGTADIAFSGAWQVATVGDQLLQSSAEDLSFRRGFWLSHGGPFPSVMFRDGCYAHEPDFKPGVSQYPLPETGKEMAAPRKELVYASGHAEFEPGTDWRTGAVISGLGTGNNGSFDEFSAPGALEKRVDELKAENASIILVNGLLSRHTYPTHNARIRKVLKRLTDAAHPKGMHVIDHWDFSLLWNCDSGFRVLTGRTGQLQRTIDCGLPNRGLCPTNPAARQALAKELLAYIRESDIDGIMIDEATYHGINFCGCGYCRDKFTADTGWVLPADETSPELNNKLSPLWRAWLSWRQKAIGDFWVALRDEVRKVRRDFVFIGYTTHYGFYSDYATNNFGAAMEQLCRAWDFVGTEIMSRNIFASYRSVACFRRMKNMFRNVNHVPVFGLVYSSDLDWNVLYFGWALNNMHAQTTWEMTEMSCPEGAPNYHLFGAEEGNFDAAAARSKAKIALLFSTRGRDCERSASAYAEVMGLSQILGAHHVPHEFIYEAALTPEELKNYEVLIVGNATAMSKTDVDAIADYAQNGGIVWMANFAGYYNGVCMKDEHWYAGEKLLAGSDYGASGSAARFTELRDPASGETWVPEGKNYYLAQKLSPQLKPLFELVNEGKVVSPGAVYNRLGKGIVYYTPAALAAPATIYEVTTNDVMEYGEKPNVEAAAWAVFQKIVPASALVWETENVPEKVVTSIYEVPGGKLCVHFLNATKSNLKVGEKVPGKVPEGAFAPLDSEMSFTVEFDGKRAYAVSPEWQGKRDLPLTKTGGKVTVKIPAKTLGAYMIVYVE